MTTVKRTKKEKSKTAAIRRSWKKLGLQARGVDVIHELHKDGITASSGIVSTVKMKLMREKMNKGKDVATKIDVPQNAPAISLIPRKPANNEVTVDDLFVTRGVINRLGHTKLQHCIELLERLKPGQM